MVDAGIIKEKRSSGRIDVVYPISMDTQTSFFSSLVLLGTYASLIYSIRVSPHSTLVITPSLSNLNSNSNS